LERRSTWAFIVERLYSGEQLVEVLGRKAGEVVEVLGLATEFFDGKHCGSLLLSPQLCKGFILNFDAILFA
jgi:hypothetical protein